MRLECLERSLISKGHREDHAREEPSRVLIEALQEHIRWEEGIPSLLQVGGGFLPTRLHLKVKYLSLVKDLKEVFWEHFREVEL